MKFLHALIDPYYTPAQCSAWAGGGWLLAQHGWVRWMIVPAVAGATLLSGLAKSWLRRREARHV